MNNKIIAKELISVAQELSGESFIAEAKADSPKYTMQQIEKANNMLDDAYDYMDKIDFWENADLKKFEMKLDRLQRTVKRISEFRLKASKKIAAISNETKSIYDPIEYALVDYYSTGYTTGPALKLVKAFGECVEKSKKFFDKKEYSKAMQEIKYVGENLRQLSPLFGSWKRWGIPLDDGCRKVYNAFNKKLSEEYLDLKREIQERDLGYNQYYNED